MNQDFEEAAANGDDMKAATSKRLSGRVTGLIVIALLAIFCFIVFAGNRNTPSPMELRQIVMQNQQFDVNRFMLDKLQENRILMLADECHGNYMYLQRLVGFLNYWVDTQLVEGAHNSELCHKLFLVVEGDPVNLPGGIGLAAKGLEGDSITLEDSWAPQLTMESVEYRRDLAMLIQRVDSVNAAEGEHRIQFEVFCPESSIVDLTNWTVAKREDYFINRRDQYSSRKAVDLLEHNPTQKRSSTMVARISSASENSRHPTRCPDMATIWHTTSSNDSERMVECTLWISEFTPSCRPRRIFCVTGIPLSQLAMIDFHARIRTRLVGQDQWTESSWTTAGGLMELRSRMCGQRGSHLGRSSIFRKSMTPPIFSITKLGWRY